MKIIKKIMLVLLLIFIVAQFFGPEKNEGNIDTVNAFIAETNPPEKVLDILKTSCFDCHSAKTSYPWYNNITPVNYWLADHVNDGKKHLDFSKWNTYSLKKKEHKMDELYEEVEKGEMPLDSYTWTHSEANLTQEQINAIVTWGKKVQADYKQQMTAE
ncbi:heme-binding domain-containing protein [Polaribacter vadi]|uniref:heme-binding domain-containing protein n=1 Tax=Polaribacter TaxID=52959 RepID=UPI001C0A47E8|nr:MULTISPECIES: heme-binding domain-containing protein [Polaribacter]MBU3010194.1 heme-binding domain-containing protein [Polaribacter vadi]MDO6740001.1 heme-binding domain-containing protein [Polaribacter sp. 1_MG-2023]